MIKGRLKEGTLAPDFRLTSLDGESFGLSETLRRNRGVHLVFLRHLG